MKRLRITVEGKSYEVTVEELPELSPSTPSTPGVSHKPIPGLQNVCGTKDPTVYSPLTGKVIAIHVSPQQRVRAGEKLITLEAMKMHTFIMAPRDATIASIKVSVGQNIQADAPTIVLAP